MEWTHQHASGMERNNPNVHSDVVIQYMVRSQLDSSLLTPVHQIMHSLHSLARDGILMLSITKRTLCSAMTASASPTRPDQRWSHGTGFKREFTARTIPTASESAMARQLPPFLTIRRSTTILSLACMNPMGESQFAPCHRYSSYHQECEMQAARLQNLCAELAAVERGHSYPVHHDSQVLSGLQGAGT